jgi:hypothetical protein
MQPIKIIIYLLTALMMSSSVTAHAFWGFGEDNKSGLNLGTGYDTNTVTTVTGHIVSVQTGNDHGNAQLELESGGVRIVAVLGPQSFWADNGIDLRIGDNVMVRGSKAQGKDGVVYIMVQKITDTTRNTEATLRNEAGRLAWSGGGTGGGTTMNANRPAPMRQQSPGRMGGGRMGR